MPRESVPAPSPHFSSILKAESHFLFPHWENDGYSSNSATYYSGYFIFTVSWLEYSHTLLNPEFVFKLDKFIILTLCMFKYSSSKVQAT